MRQHKPTCCQFLSAVKWATMHSRLPLQERRYSFPHARALLDHIPEPLVKFDDDRVRGPDLQVDLVAAHRPKTLLRFAHKCGADALAAARIQNGQCIKPTSMPVVAGHDRANRDISIKS